MRQHRKQRRPLRSEILEIRRCLAASLGWDGPGQGSADLSYYIGAAPAGLNQAAVESAIETALEAWSDVIDVDFTRTSLSNQRDSIDFSFGSIDGSGGTLAQAYLPDDVNRARIAGDVEFDISEQWEIGNGLGRRAFDLARVAVHEVGHALGIDHLNVSGSVMAPYVSPTEQFTGLRSADVDAALALYAAATPDSTSAETLAESGTTNHDTTAVTPDTQMNPADEIDDTADSDTPDTNRNRRPWLRFWWWRSRWTRFGSRLIAAPAQHNAVMPADVNQDGQVTSRDALTVINQLNSNSDGSSAMTDTNGDGNVTSRDALFVINEVGRIAMGASTTAGMVNELESVDDEDVDSDDDEVMIDDGALETETEVGDTEDVESDEDEDVDDTAPKEEADDDTSPVDDATPVDASNTVHDTTPTADTPPLEDPSPADDIPSADDTPPNDNGETTDEEEEEGHCPGFGRRSIGLAVERLFTLLDTNEDGALTDGEVPESLITTLAPVDANVDGMITLEELQDSRPDHASRRFAFLDDNADGVVTADEVNADIWERLSPADANADDAVTAEELGAYRDSLPSRAFTRLDDNGDGLIMQDEVNEMIWTILVASDSDGDSAISSEEFPEPNSFRHRGARFAGFRDFRIGARFR